jgi:alkylation response protein AidB-like acyl-CoA dehydrogenase
MSVPGRVIDKHAVEMSPAEQEHAIDIAREVAAEFDRVGREYDDRNEFPMETVPIFKDSGLVQLMVPKEYGGMGCDILTLARVTTELAKGDPACALAYNMHFAMVGIFRGLLDGETRAYWMNQFASENKLVNGTLSEERAGLMGLADTVAVPQSDGGYKISGRKTWGTLCEAADIVSLNATVTDEHGNLPEHFGEHTAREYLFMLPMDTPGIRIDRTWNALGMKATGTHSVVYEDVLVPAEARVRDYRGGLFGEFEWAALSFAGVYQGLLEKAYEETIKILKTKTLGATMEAQDLALKDLGHVQYGLGRMTVMKEASSRVLETSCRQVMDGRDQAFAPQARIPLIDIAKVISTEYAIDVVDQGMRLVGGSAFRHGHILEKLYRDARSGPFHPLTTDQVYNTLGRSELGLYEAAGEPAGH